MSISDFNIFTMKDKILSRKAFLAQAGLLFASFQLPREIYQAKNYDGKDLILKSPVKSVVFVNMDGGMSHVDTLDPKADSKFSPVNTTIRGIRVMDTFSRTARQLHHLSMIRTTISEDGDHDMAQHLLNTGYRTTDTVGIPDLPHMGAMISYAKSIGKKESPYFPGFITIGNRRGKIGDPGYLPIGHAGFHISDPNKPLSNMTPVWGKFDEDRLKKRENFLDALNNSYQNENSSVNLDIWDKMYTQAREFRDSTKLIAFDWSKESERVQKRYGETYQSRAFLLAKRLVEIEVPFIQITIGGWDTHTDNQSRIAKIMSDTDQGLAAFLEELAVSGLLKQTLFILSSEFGRTPVVGSRDGRDHHPRVWTTLIGGGEISKGRIIGESDKDGEKPILNSETLHVRDLIASLHQYAGVNPKSKLMNSQDRPIGVAHPRSNPIRI